MPVLLVRGHVRWPADRPPRILVPLDGSELSAAIVPVVAGLGRPLHAVIELLHVLEGMPAIYPELPQSLPGGDPATERRESTLSVPPRR